MAACPPPLVHRVHLRSVYCASSCGSLRPFTPCDHIQLLCQTFPTRSFVLASASSKFYLHDGSPVEIRVSESSSRVIEPSISSDFIAREASFAECRLDASAAYASEYTAAESRVEDFVDRKVSQAFVSAEACTSCSVTDTHALSLSGARLAGEVSPSNEACSTSYSTTKVNVSSLRASSDAAESTQSLSSASLQTRDRSKVVRTAWEALVRWSRSWQLLNSRKATNVLQRTRKVVVVGGGSFGTAMAVLLARNKAEMQVSLLLRDSSLCESINDNHINTKYFPKHILPHNIVATIYPQEAFKDSEFCIHAVPVQYSAEFLKSISEHVPPSLPFFSVSKGLELSSLEMMSQVIPRALGNQRQPIAVISGPSFSIELMDELPTAMVVASKDKELARAAQQLLASRYLRINTSSDVVGVEIAGALKNVLAIAAGIVEGMNLGNNCMAALVAQGCSEIRWLAEKMGAKSTTLAGLSGTGDIMLTCFVNLSRNRSVGVRLGSGESLGHILSSMNQVAEGVATAGAVIALARKYRVQMPVLTAVARILENELTPKKAVLELMSLPQVEEV